MHQLERRADGVRHRVHDAQERVAEGHAGDRAGVVHLLPRPGGGRRAGLAGHRLLEVGEDQPDRVQGHPVGEVVRVDRHVRLGGVGQRVETGVGRQRGRHVRGQHRVDDRHGGRQGVVGQRVLGAGDRVGDHRERGHLGAGARGRRDADELGQAAQGREA